MTQARTLVTFPSEVPKKASSKDPRDVTGQIPIEDPNGILREIPGEDLSKDPSNDPSRVPSEWCPQQGLQLTTQPLAPYPVLAPQVTLAECPVRDRDAHGAGGGSATLSLF